MILSELRRVTGVLAVAAASAFAAPAVAQSFDFSETFSRDALYETFLYTPPDHLFHDTGENRFDKAVRVFSQTLDGVPSELTQIASFPMREPLLFGASVAGIGALVAFDRPLTIFYKDRIEPIFEGFHPPRLSDWPNWMATEDQYIVAGMGLTYAYGLAANDERAQVTAMLAGKAMAYSYLTSQLILKPIFGRMRPLPNLSTFTGTEADANAMGYSTTPFNWFNQIPVPFRAVTPGTAMPSFHYSMYFAVARVYSGMYDNSVLPYLALGVLAVGNIRGHNHWVSDMAAGALIGTGIGNVVLSSYADRRGGLDMTFTPRLSTKEVGFSMSMRF